MNFDESLSYLLGLGHETLAIKLGLENTERLLEALGHPQNSFPSVQIAGTNGKGSTAVMLESISHAVHIKTGLYTSPHLVRINERIRIDGSEISAEAFARLATRARDAAERLLSESKLQTLPTFFEHLTAIALLAFKEAQVDLAILETGLGGRLDATTCAGAQVVAITPISLDHQEYLGQTIEEIASEKAAIIREGVTAIVAPQAAEALRVIMKRCAECHVTPRVDECRTKVVGADETGRLQVTFETKQERYENVRLGLRGRHQVTNAATAVSLAEALCERGFSIQKEAIIAGLEESRHAGRLELRAGRPSILFDGAHNAAGAQALRDYLDEFMEAPLTIIFGAMRDKDLQEIAGKFFPAASRLILTVPQNPRAATLETLTKVVPEGFTSSRITLAPSAHEALLAAQAQTPPEGIICVTGSLYLVGEVKSLID